MELTRHSRGKKKKESITLPTFLFSRSSPCSHFSFHFVSSLSKINFTLQVNLGLILEIGVRVMRRKIPIL